MVKISYEDFMKLSEEEKCVRYKDMNDYDRHRSRLTEPIVVGRSIGYIKLTEEQKKKGKLMTEVATKIIEINTKGND